MLKRIIYFILIFISNLFACLFLGLVFIGSFSMSSEAPNPLNELQVILRIIIYGLGICFLFSLISLLIGLIFKKRLFIKWLKLSSTD